MLTPRRPNPARQRGLSIVEMMVGVAIGLIVVAAAALVVSSQLGENRRLLVETQIQQDLRATTDIVARELRRAGAWHEAHRGLWFRGTGGVQQNPFDTLTVVGGTTGAVAYSYHRQSGSEGPYGFRLTGGVMQASLDGGVYQDLTDARTLEVTNFSITQSDNSATPTRVPCPALCADATQNCWPNVAVREFVVVIEGRARSDPSVRQRIQSNVRVRNDKVSFNTDVPSQFCP